MEEQYQVKSYSSKCTTAASKTHQTDERETASKKRRSIICLEMIAAYGGLCACCGEDWWEFLTIDHVGGGGNKHCKEVGSGSKFYRWLKEQGWPQIGYRLLCFNCNAAHGLLGYCPHQSEIKRG
jgi:hypothetical protein